MREKCQDSTKNAGILTPPKTRSLQAVHDLVFSAEDVAISSPQNPGNLRLVKH